MYLEQALRAAFAVRRGHNPRYSLRAFARDLGVDHSTLSQLMREERAPGPSMVRRLGKQLGLSPDQLMEMSIAHDARAILSVVRRPDHRTRVPWIAQRTGIPMDAVNIALQWALRHGLLTFTAPDRWTLHTPSHA